MLLKHTYHMNRSATKIAIIAALVFSGLTGQVYLQYCQDIAVINVVEEETEQGNKEVEKKETKEYISDRLEIHFSSTKINQKYFSYIVQWKSLPLEPVSPPPEQV